ncbi:ribosome silencing factor [Kiloniella spongiae]|uniref:ribosome silencing factor n=1 Tax=Kiloniella spongiae TaxID=1489064 RepID=UPI0026ADEDC0
MGSRDLTSRFFLRRPIIPRESTAPEANTQDTTGNNRDLLELVRNSLEDDKAEDIVVIELAGKSSIADYMVIASGNSNRMVSAMSDHLLRGLKAAGMKSIIAEGKDRGDWVLVDAGDVVVHLFRPEVRAFYNLEKMWGLELPESAQPFASKEA